MALWAVVSFVLTGFHAAAAVYNYEVTGTFPSNTTPTAFWAPNGHFEYRFNLEPQTLSEVDPESSILNFSCAARNPGSLMTPPPGID